MGFFEQHPEHAVRPATPAERRAREAEAWAERMSKAHGVCDACGYATDDLMFGRCPSCA